MAMAVAAAAPSLAIVGQVQAKHLTFYTAPCMVTMMKRSNSDLGRRGRMRMVIASATPSPTPNLNDKVAQSIKDAEETCAENPVSGECKASWDEVEELSATAARKRQVAKDQQDPLEQFCNDNPETDECRVYDS